MLEQSNLFLFVLNELKPFFRSKPYFRNLIIPILLGLILYVLSFLLGLIVGTTPSSEQNYSKMYLLFRDVLIGPFLEEFLIRFIILGSILFTFENKVFPIIDSRIRSDSTLVIKYIIVAFLLFLQAVIFAYIHEERTLAQLIIRTLAGLLFGFVFYYNNKNLLSAVSCHSAYNCLLLITSPNQIL